MARFYDVESFIADLETHFKATLNGKITAINTEKGDSALATVNANAYYFQSMNEVNHAYDPIVFYYIDQLNSIPNGQAVARTMVIEFVLAFTCRGDSKDMKRALRYSRALEEAAADGWRTILRSVRVEVESLMPVDFKFANSNNLMKAVGVSLTVDLP